MKFRECVCQVLRHANVSLYMPFSGKPFSRRMGSEEKYRASASLCERLKCELSTSSIDHDIAACDAHAHTTNVAHGKVRSSESLKFFATMYRCKYGPILRFCSSSDVHYFVSCWLDS